MEPASEKSEEVFQLGTQNDVEDNQQSEKEDEDNDEDVPGDFFDDFLKEDFMAGLDIVDEDEGDEEKEKQNSNSNGRPMTLNQLRRIKRRKSPKDKRRKDKKEKKKVDEKEDTKKRKKTDNDEQKKNKKSREAGFNADEFDIRRDPKKTKRDIARDKAKCEKDKEKKIITEKLKLVETGLVPPGMEMEMDIEQVKKQKKEMERQENSEKLKSQSPGRSSRTTDMSPRRRKSRSPIKTASPRRRSPGRRVSPRRSPRRSSPRRISPRRSPIRRSPVRRSRERSIGRTTRRSRSLSPYYRNRRTRYSPGRTRYSPGRNRASPNHDSYSRHRRSRSRSAKRKREEKKSFLQEIAEKLNETRPIQMMPVQHMRPLPTMTPEVYNLNRQLTQLSHPSPVPAPAPVPPPMLVRPQFNPPQNHPPQNHPPQNHPPQNHPPQNHPPQNHPPHNRPPHLQTYDPYDKNFFIGTPQPQPVPNYSGSPHQMPKSLPHPSIPVNTVQPPVQSPVVLNQGNIVPPSQSSNNMSSTNYRATPQMLHRRIESKEDIAKLFQDKKITLSEFLAITAKPEVYSECPAHLQEKIKVISRCQDAIKVLGNSEKKFIGPLVVRKTKKTIAPEDKFKSPLMKFSQLKIPFTEVPKKDQRRSAFTNYMDYLLQSIGLMNEVIVDVDDQDVSSNVGTTTRLDQGSPPPPPQISHGRSNSHNEPPKRIPNLTNLSNNQLSKFIQTEVWKCHDCEKRNKISYKSTGIQSGGEPVTYSVSTQVTEDDFFVKIPKNQSLASLTPAQLLAKSGSKFSRNVEVDDFDLMFPSKNTRTSFGRGSETYGMTRYNPPSSPPRFPPSNREDPTFFQNPPFPMGGRGRGNQPQSSFNNSYY